MTTTLQHPTQLWIADTQTLHDNIILHLQKILCKNDACAKCIVCQQIAKKEHPWIIWIIPERSYTLEQIDEIITIASFQLDFHEQRFFILPEAERLTDQCANRLLKTIEEPSPGYNFFFLTARPEALPLTIQSRCVVQKFKTKTSFELYKDFLQPFLQLKFIDPINFIKQLETFDIKEQESKELADELFIHWSTIFKQEIQIQHTDTTTTDTLVKILQAAINKPPMTGSSKIFWRNLYINCHYATKTTKIKN